MSSPAGRQLRIPCREKRAARSRAGILCLLLAGLAIVLSGCEPDPVAHDLRLGVHRLHLLAPAGWQVFHQGDHVLLRRDACQLVIQDLGPAGVAGIRHEVEFARELWRDGRSREARLMMRNAYVPPHLFRSVGQRAGFWEAWARVSGAPEDAEFATVEAAFEDVLARVAALEPRGLDELVETTLAELDPERRDDLMQRRAISVGGRQGLVADTWDRLSHARERRIAMVLNDGYLLLLRTEWGESAMTKPAFDQVLGSLEFRSIEPTLVGRPTPSTPTQ